MENAVIYGVATLGVAVVVIAVAFGISKIGRNAMDAIARQPEAAADIRTTMILAAALIEGIGFFAAVICLLIVLLK